jgi:rRNA maturation protein Nop10
MRGIDDNPQIPGSIAQCEWCGLFVNSFTAVPLHFCPSCHHGTLRDDCPHCHAPIAFPPQLNCLNCGKQFTVMKVVPMPGGLGTVNIIEPDAQRRKELEVKGHHWHDVVRGDAEGPDLPKMDTVPPPGWNKEDFDRVLRHAKVDQGEDLISVGLGETEDGPGIQHCERCQVTFVLKDDILEVCPFCGNELEEPGA